MKLRRKEEMDQILPLERDGRFYYNVELDRIESIIPNPYVSCHAADLLELPNGDLLCCWFAGSNEGNADISIVLSRLKAEEKKWSTPILVSDDPTMSEQNPSLFLAPNGEIWMIYTAQVALGGKEIPLFNLQYTAEIRCKKSCDNGYTWGETEVMFSEPGSFCRQKIQVLSNGRWIFGNWFCKNDETRNGSDVTAFRISDDEGKTWRCVPLPNSEGKVHANILEMDSGRLICLMRSRFADYIYRAVSEDYGETWSIPERTELPNNNASISAIRLSSGEIAIAYNAVRFNDDTSRTVWPNQRCPITIALSEDQGKSWPYKRVAEFGEGFYGIHNDINNRRYEYPVLIQASDGTICCAYSWGDRKNVKFLAFEKKWVKGEKVCFGAEDQADMPAVYGG